MGRFLRHMSGNPTNQELARRRCRVATTLLLIQGKHIARYSVPTHPLWCLISSGELSRIVGMREETLTGVGSASVSIGPSETRGPSRITANSFTRSNSYDLRHQPHRNVGLPPSVLRWVRRSTSNA